MKKGLSYENDVRPTPIFPDIHEHVERVLFLRDIHLQPAVLEDPDLDLGVVVALVRL